MRPVAICIALIASTSSVCADAEDAATPVVVELFTSQGCSSCPPADTFLQELAQQSVKNVKIIPVSWHVDYWNRLGWTDPYSSQTATNRQNAYARQLNARNLYTPQMIVDGRTEFVGSDRRRGLQAIDRAAKSTKVSLQIVTQVQGESITITARSSDISKDWRVLAILTEDKVKTDVKRGENTGRTLQHTGVVRASGEMAVSDSGEWNTTLQSPEDADDMNAVVLVQDESGRMVAAASMSIAN